MKISVLQHDPQVHLPQRKGDATPITRNLDPLAHPFARARERTRALNAAKIERMFSKPFVASLEGHIDGVYTLATRAGDLETITSGSGDGAHKGTVSAITYAEGPRLLSCGVDRTVKLWDTSVKFGEGELEQEAPTPLNIFPGKAAFNAIDHHRTDQLFATASNIVQLWDESKFIPFPLILQQPKLTYFLQSRSEPISNLTFPTSNETITALKFNLSESSILATTGTDRTMTLYDIRTGKAERRLVMEMRANALSWCPTFPTTVLLASEDHNLYTFDVRSLSNPTQIYKGHVAAVMCCAWSPTGQEFVSGGWDRTIRMWKEGVGSGPVVYSGKRMQRYVGGLDF
ncbi:U3 small nucleolar RNA associated protein [Ceratobasidium theobromae]|uniref:U3 small nucleolar RNA associated protein n=1 Tax=Ceratobasidium theobromae TaxID=1582974 RepID=A0A5N5QAR9_9AGAM|nr:U3 small nucleolar RNA associated protein [Ceratobasidium theobromae]